MYNIKKQQPKKMHTEQKYISVYSNNVITINP